MTQTFFPISRIWEAESVEDDGRPDVVGFSVGMLLTALQDQVKSTLDTHILPTLDCCFCVPKGYIYEAIFDSCGETVLYEFIFFMFLYFLLFVYGPCDNIYRNRKLNFVMVSFSIISFFNSIP